MGEKKNLSGRSNMGALIWMAGMLICAATPIAITFMGRG